MYPNGLCPIRRALVSVSDKSGLAEFAGFLHARGVEILSTGGSARALTEAGIPVVEVSAYSGFPEIMDGRVKTLHPKIHGGILARRDLESHRSAMTAHGITAIDLVVVNLYPFEATLDSGADEASCIENIDIGGPAMVRAAAKNHEFVILVAEPKDYQAVIDEMTAHDGATTFALRRRLAAAGFAHVAAYDARIAAWLEERRGETFPDRLVFAGTRRRVLRYGENPHQTAAFYAGGRARIGVASAVQTQGKALSYNNLNDADAGFELVSEFAAPEFDRPAVAIIKHANPCGVALGESLVEAYGRALACDAVSAFGGIIAVNRRLDAATAAEITKLFAEVVIAPEIAPEAQRILAEKTKLRVLVTGALADPADPGPLLRSLAGGYLLQSRDNGRVTAAELKVVTKRRPSAPEQADLLFA